MLSQGVYDTLMELLMNGSIAPGGPLRVDTLARELGVSQTPIREALPRIEAAGLIIRQPLRGYRVAPPLSPDEVDKLTEARLLIEPHNTARVCEAKDPAVAAELAESLKDMRAAPTGPGYREFRQHLEADARFHSIISRNCGNRFLGDSVERLGSHVQRFRLYSGAAVSDAHEGIAEHEIVLDAIVNGTPEEARLAMVMHLTNVRERAEADAARLAEKPVG
ncbi:GntR family transcriptional regulator [Lacisediminihabitans sp.]|uniref:GntR family transcriptional regulator n=1 Tax=Lacisediminihabitans sp. TaxID=2787631 RepID=UPI002EDA2244